MPPRKDFRSKRAFKVVSFKGGKAVKKQKVNIPARLTVHKDALGNETPGMSSNSDGPSDEQIASTAEDLDFPAGGSTASKKLPRFLIKRKLRAYHTRKSRLAKSWLNFRAQIVTAALSREALPLGQKCLIPCCTHDALGRCLDCGPAMYLCEEHIQVVHAGGKSLHKPQAWKEGRYVPYHFDQTVWTTCHNLDHGYVRDITAIDVHGRQHAIKLKCCEHEPEAITIIRNGFWPSTPKQPHVAFDIQFMTLLQYIFLECRVSLKSIHQALLWLAPSCSKVFVKDIYRLLVGDCFSEFRYMSSVLNSLNHFIPSFSNEHECPACPKENGSMFISLDALFGCVRKSSAGKSGKASNHGEELFIGQDKVDKFLSTYNKASTSKTVDPSTCNQFQAGSNLRSKIKSQKLDETALFGAACRHEVPLKFFSLKRGEEIGNAVFLLMWLKESIREKGIDLYLFYDIACVLHAHLRNTHQENLLTNVIVAIPSFHCYGHKVSCQVNYSGKRLKGFGLSDGEVMERLWSFLRPTGKITKEMTAANRVDALTDFLIHYAKKSVANIGERLCDHLKKAKETREETEDQLALLIRKLAETGTKVEESTIEEWTLTEKESIMRKTNGEKSDLSATVAYQEKLKRYYTVRTSLEECRSGSDTWKILTKELNRLDEELKKIENGQQRWSPDSSMYQSYILSVEDKRRESLLLTMHGKCTERWFLLQLMKKYADGQAVAKKLCSQITKATNAVKQLIKQYERGDAALSGSKYPSKVELQEALDVSSTLWATLDDSSLFAGVPYCIKRQIIDFKHMITRCNEEEVLLKDEMSRVLTFYQRKIGVLENWSKKLPDTTELVDGRTRGMKALVLSKLDGIKAFSLYLRDLFARQNSDDEEVRDEGILTDSFEEDQDADSNNGDNGDDHNDDDAVQDSSILELEEQDVLEDLLSVLNTEYGSDDVSDTDTDVSVTDTDDP